MGKGSKAAKEVDPPSDLFWDVVPEYVTNHEVCKRFVRYMTKGWQQACADVTVALETKEHAPVSSMQVPLNLANGKTIVTSFVKAWIQDSLYRLYQACQGLNGSLEQEDAAKMFTKLCAQPQAIPRKFMEGLPQPQEDWNVPAQAVQDTFAELRRQDEKENGGAAPTAAAKDKAPAWWRKSAQEDDEDYYNYYNGVGAASSSSTSRPDNDSNGRSPRSGGRREEKASSSNDKGGRRSSSDKPMSSLEEAMLARRELLASAERAGWRPSTKGPRRRMASAEPSEDEGSAPKWGTSTSSRPARSGGGGASAWSRNSSWSDKRQWGRGWRDDGDWGQKSRDRGDWIGWKDRWRRKDVSRSRSDPPGRRGERGGERNGGERNGGERTGGGGRSSREENAHFKNLARAATEAAGDAKLETRRPSDGRNPAQKRSRSREQKRSRSRLPRAGSKKKPAAEDPYLAMSSTATNGGGGNGDVATATADGAPNAEVDAAACAAALAVMEAVAAGQEASSSAVPQPPPPDDAGAAEADGKSPPSGKKRIPSGKVRQAAAAAALKGLRSGRADTAAEATADAKNGDDAEAAPAATNGVGKKAMASPSAVPKASCRQPPGARAKAGARKPTSVLASAAREAAESVQATTPAVQRAPALRKVVDRDISPTPPFEAEQDPYLSDNEVAQEDPYACFEGYEEVADEMELQRALVEAFKETKESDVADDSTTAPADGEDAEQEVRNGNPMVCKGELD